MPRDVCLDIEKMDSPPGTLRADSGVLVLVAELVVLSANAGTLVEVEITTVLDVVDPGVVEMVEVVDGAAVLIVVTLVEVDLQSRLEQLIAPKEHEDQ